MNKPQMQQIDSNTLTYMGVLITKKAIKSTSSKFAWAFQIDGIDYLEDNRIEVCAKIRKVMAAINKAGA